MPESSTRTTISSSPSTFVAGFLSCPYILLKGLEHVLHGTNIDVVDRDVVDTFRCWIVMFESILLPSLYI